MLFAFWRRLVRDEGGDLLSGMALVLPLPLIAVPVFMNVCAGS